jgi:CDP-diacylglycerol--serine O-phosphatidyltransferase
VLFLVVAGLVVFYKEVGMLCVCLGYIFFGLVRHWRRQARVRRAGRSV